MQASALLPQIPQPLPDGPTGRICSNSKCNIRGNTAQMGMAMSGHENSGLTRSAHDDRETLLAAIEVIERRWPVHREATGELLRRLVRRVTEEN